MQRRGDVTAAGAAIRYVPKLTFQASGLSMRQSSSTVATTVEAADCGLGPASADVANEEQRKTMPVTTDPAALGDMDAARRT